MHESLIVLAAASSLVTWCGDWLPLCRE